MASANQAAHPKPVVTYYPDGGWLDISNGKPFGEGETIAQGVVLFYDRADERQVVGISIMGGAKYLFEPLVNEALKELGLPCVDTPITLSAEARRKNNSVSTSPDPVPMVRYDSASGILLVENGSALGETSLVAEGVEVFAEAEDPQWAGGFRIGPDVRKILKPFLDAVLEEHGGKKTKGAT